MVVVGILLFFFCIWVWSLIDAINNAKNTVVWVLVILFAGFLGSILWFCMGEKKTPVIAGRNTRRLVRRGNTRMAQRGDRGERGGTRVTRRPISRR